MRLTNYYFYAALLLPLFLLQCNEPVSYDLPPADPDNGGLRLPGGFSAVVVAEELPGQARHLAIRDNGDIYVNMRRKTPEGGNIALRDTDGDGKADLFESFGQYRKKWGFGSASRIYKDYLYYSTELAVYRSKLIPGQLLPDTTKEIMLIDDHAHKEHEHIAKPVSFDNKGNMYVPFGAPSNACQEPKRTPGQPGLDPCPQLEDHAGIWKFDAETPGQTQKDGVKFATGIRSVVAMDWNKQDENLYVVIHGRDDLVRLFPELYSPWESAMLPSEEFVRVKEGDHFGWPYCYYDQMISRKVQAPEYGGDGKMVGRCADYEMPLIGFPGHWAPNDLYFYQGDQFPARYKHGAFIAMHGSTIRAPYPQSGYFIAFVPFSEGKPSGTWEVFANGFAGVDPIVNVNDAEYRPMGIAEGPDGSLYLTETEKGKIWRVMFTGEREKFGSAQLASMEGEREASNVRTPDEEEDNLQKEQLTGGDYLYFTYCGICHQSNGKGSGERFPPLAGTDWVTGNKERLIDIVMNGREGPMTVNGQNYNNVMPQHSFLSDDKLALVLSYIRNNFGNDASSISAEEVAAVRAQTKP
ncbi:MAG: PQQ-dependent sugar dehydrogenase [Bacteroidota bacterium]